MILKFNLIKFLKTNEKRLNESTTHVVEELKSIFMNITNRIINLIFLHNANQNTLKTSFKGLKSKED
jgi:hypothetical protein